MNWLIVPKEFPQPTGMIKIVESISLTLVGINRTDTTVATTMSILFNGRTVDINGNPQTDSLMSQTLHSDYLLRTISEILVANGVPQENSAAMAEGQISTLLGAFYFGSFDQAYGAASMLASQFSYVLLPIKRQKEQFYSIVITDVPALITSEPEPVVPPTEPEPEIQEEQEPAPVSEPEATP
jgi:hypothetical protein